MAGYDFKRSGGVFKEGIYEVPEYQRNYMGRTAVK